MTAGPLPCRVTARPLALVLTWVASALPAVLGAQKPAARSALHIGTRDSALLASLAALRPRERVLADTGGWLLAGRYLGHDADTLWVKTGSGGSGAVPVERIRALHVQRGTYAGPFAIVGALLIAPIGMIGAGVGCGDTGVTTSGDCLATGLLVGAAAGAAAGAALGFVFPRYARRYPPPRPRPRR